MAEKFSKYFNSGEFAKLCGVNKQTLIYYDKIGIFSPEITDTNGYRYYSYKQYDIFNIILALKEMNTSLKQIKTYLDNRTPDTLIELFKARKLELNREIQKLNKVSQLIEVKINITKQANKINYKNVRLEEKEEEYLILSNPIKQHDYKIYFKTLVEYINYCYDNNLDDGYPVSSIINRENILKQNYSHLSYYYTKINNKIDLKYCFVKPKGIYAVIYHYGDYDSTYKTYNILLKYLKENNLNIISDSYENTIIDSLSVKNPNNYITELSLQVESCKS